MKNTTESRFEKFGLVMCKGLGYPHWKNHIFEVIAIFDDGDLLLNNNIKVSHTDFSTYKLKTFGHGYLDVFKSMIRKRGYICFDHKVNSFVIDIVYRKKLVEYFKDIDFIGWYETKDSIVIVTKDDIIIVNQNYNNDNWGVVGTEFSHTYIKKSEITDCFMSNTTTIKIVLEDNKYEISLQSDDDIINFVNLFD